MLKILKTRSKGEANFIAGLLVTFMLVVFVFASVSMYSVMNRAADIRSACRGYLYTMETKGCLTESNKSALTSELQQLGCRNIDYTGTTLAPVEYGQVVTLTVNCDIPVSIFNFGSLTGQKALQNVTIVRRTIAKN